MYVPGGEHSAPTAVRARAALAVVGVDAVAALHTAADLLGFGVLDDGMTHLAAVPGADCAPRPGLRVHAVLDALDRVTVVAGVPCTSAERTAVDLARRVGRLDALAVLDAALRSGRCTTGSLTAEVDRHAGRRGVVQARELVPLADARAESPMESRLRLRVLDGGLPGPELQWRLPESGVQRYRLDLAWPGRRVGAEYDGAPAHLLRSQLRHDRERHNWLTGRAGWRLLYFTDVDVYRLHRRLVGLLEAELSRPTLTLSPGDQGEHVAS